MPNSKFASFSGRLILFVTVVVIVFGIFSYANYGRFHSRVAQLKLDGELQSLDELTHIVENEEDDSLIYLRSAAEPAQEFARIIPRDDDGHSITNADAIASFEELHSKYPTVFETIKRAANAPDMTIKPDFDSERNLGALEIQKIGLALEWKGSIHNAMGEHDAAAEVAIQLLQLAEKVDEPTILNSLLSNAFRVLACQIACDAVAMGDVDGEIVTKINQLMDQAQVMDSYTKSLKAERSLSTYFMINSHLIDDDRKNIHPSGIEWLAMKVPSGPAIVVGNSFLDQMETAIERSQTPLTIQFPQEKPKWSILNAFGGNAGPFYNRLRTSIGQKIATYQATRIILALEQSDDADQRENWPQDYLISLGVPERMTVDPFTGNPMTIKSENGIWHVYSFGPDKIDNGDESTTDNTGMKTRILSN